MGKQRTTFGKLQREREKQAKAQAKQERKQAQAREAKEAEPVVVEPSATQEQLLDAFAALHADAEAGRISLEQFELRREQIREELAAGNWA